MDWNGLERFRDVLLVTGCNLQQLAETRSRRRSNIRRNMRWVYVDGACIRNGQPDAGAGYGVWFGNKHELNVSEVVSGDKHSSQVAELQAAKAAIRIATREDFDGLKIFTDSEYVYNGITNWILNWRENGWRTSAGKPVANQSEWKELEDVIDFFEEYHGEIVWRWVKAHNGNFGNEEADRLAKEAAQRAYDNQYDDVEDDDDDDDDSDDDYYY